MANNQTLKKELEKELSHILDYVATKENIEKAFLMVKLGADLWTTNHSNRNFLHLVIEFDDLNIFHQFIKEFQYNPAARDSTGYGAFDYAAKYLSVKIMKWLISEYNVTKRSIKLCMEQLCRQEYRNETEAKMAIEAGQLLLESGANIFQCSKDGWSLLYLAERSNGMNGIFTKFIRLQYDKERMKYDGQILMGSPEPGHAALREKESVASLKKTNETLLESERKLLDQVCALKAENKSLQDIIKILMKVNESELLAGLIAKDPALAKFKQFLSQ